MRIENALPLQVLIVDDDKNYVLNFLQLDANPYRIKLIHARTLDDGEQILQENGESTLDGIILDVVGLKDRDSKIPNESFIGNAIAICDKKAPGVPMVVLTAETKKAEELKKYYDETHRIFLKSRMEDVKEMFAYFVEEGEKKEERLISEKYNDIFEIFAKKDLEEATKQELLSCLKNMHSSELNAIRGVLNSLRIIQEDMYFALSKHDDQMVPRQFVTNETTGRKEVKFSNVLYHLKGKYDQDTKKSLGKPYIHHGSLIDKLSLFAYRGCSEGMHAIEKDEPIKPSNYTVQAITNAVLDLLLWFKKTVSSSRQ